MSCWWLDMCRKHSLSCRNAPLYFWNVSPGILYLGGKVGLACNAGLSNTTLPFILLSFNLLHYVSLCLMSTWPSICPKHSKPSRSAAASLLTLIKTTLSWTVFILLLFNLLQWLQVLLFFSLDNLNSHSNKEHLNKLKVLGNYIISSRTINSNAIYPNMSKFDLRPGAVTSNLSSSSSHGAQNSAKIPQFHPQTSKNWEPLFECLYVLYEGAKYSLWPQILCHCWW